MIDFHCHILPALDDGALSVDESIAMARALVVFGYTTVCCTPHCLKGYYDLTPHKVREATLMLQADLDNADIPLQLRPGIEYMLDECFASYADDLLPLSDTNLVLCEAPPQAHPGFIRECLALIHAKGFVPLIAHPERTQYFYEILTSRDAGLGTRNAENSKPKATIAAAGLFLKKLFSSRVPRPASRGFENASRTGAAGSRLPEPLLYHANLGSFTGYYGELVQRRAYDLLKLGVYSAVVSDLHNADAAAKILQRDKLASNPLLTRLAHFDGRTSRLHIPEVHVQGELF